MCIPWTLSHTLTLTHTRAHTHTHEQMQMRTHMFRQTDVDTYTCTDVYDTHTPLSPFVGLRAQIVLILSVLHTFCCSHQRQRRFDEETHTHTHTTHTAHSIIISVSAGEEAVLFFVITGV